jgi:8-hydroxy-5-deazaflavin:NADPH oxidoreductase
MTRVGILGSGVVGRTLAEGFRRHGHQARIGSRTPEKLAEFSGTSGIAAGTFDEVAGWGELLVLAVKGTGALEALRLAGSTHLRGKTIIDTTNPLAQVPPVDGVISVFTAANSSLMEELQAAFPEAHLVKAFNTVGHRRMVNPDYPEGAPSMFYCGNDAEAKDAVAAILRQFGFEPVDLGRATAARALEPLSVLWCIPGFLHNHWTHAFKVLW